LLEIDRPFLENKYHRVGEPFNNRNCRAYHGLGCDLSSGLGDEEMLKGLEELAAQSKGLSHPVCKARAFAYVLDHTPLYDAEHDIFPGIWSWGRLIAPTTADRWRGEEEFKNASPCVGADRKGATALVLSALALHPERYTEDCCVDMMLHPSAVAGVEGLDAFDALLETYRRGGGGALHFNVVDAATLRDAQDHPEKYRNHRFHRTSKMVARSLFQYS
jgi:hypothetical protein